VGHEQRALRHKDRPTVETAKTTGNIAFDSAASIDSAQMIFHL